MALGIGIANGIPFLEERQPIIITDFIITEIDEFCIQETGGAKTVTLSTSEIPSHTHTIASNNSGSNNNLHHSNNSFVSAGDGASGTSTVTSNSTGGGSAHSNVQPYIVAYMWRRTA